MFNIYLEFNIKKGLGYLSDGLITKNNDIIHYIVLLHSVYSTTQMCAERDIIVYSEINYKFLVFICMSHMLRSECQLIKIIFDAVINEMSVR